MHRANVNFRFSLAIEISALVVVRENGWMFRQARSDVSPSRIGRIGIVDAGESIAGRQPSDRLRP